ncbi:hypothetical protein BH23PAT2_BH23PAT2_04220 [soil metagenome]
MIVLRRIGLVLGIVVLHIGLGLFVLAVVFAQLFSSPEPVKQSLTDANVYTTVQQFIIDRSANEAKSTDTGIDTSDPRFVAIAKNALSVEAIQAEAESVIDAMHAWLAGQTQQPTFSVDLSSSRQRMADGVADYAQEKLENLPHCTSLSQIQIDIDPFSATCVPPQLDPSQYRDEYANSLLTSDEFIPETTFTGNDLAQNTDVFRDSTAPDIFQRLGQGIWISIMVTIVGVATIVLLAKTKVVGSLRVSKQVLSNGVITLVSAVSLWVIINDVLNPIGTNELQSAVLDAGMLLGGQMATVMAIVGLVYVTIGGIVWALLRNKLTEKLVDISISNPNTK